MNKNLVPLIVDLLLLRHLTRLVVWLKSRRRGAVTNDQDGLVDAPNSQGKATSHAGIAQNVHLAPNDRRDPLLSTRGVVRDRTEHVGVIGERHRRHPKLFGLLREALATDGSVQQRELAMHVQMDELGHEGSHLALTGVAVHRHTKTLAQMDAIPYLIRGS